MKILVHDQQLEDLAKKYAKKCVWKHSDKNARKTAKYLSVGENLSYKYGTGYNPDFKTAVKKAVKGWAGEAKYYNYFRNKCDYGRVCGHYTQLVWAKTEAVGCAGKRGITLIKLVNNTNTSFQYK